MSSTYELRRGVTTHRIELVPDGNEWKGRMVAEDAPWVTGRSQGEVEDRLLELYGQYDEEEGVWRA